MKKIIKYLLIGIGIALTLITIWFCLVYDFRGEKVLIPYDYSGTCIIFYNVPNGEDKKTDGYFDRITLKIPPSGVLVVNFKDYLGRNTPLQNRDYYLYNPKTGEIVTKLNKKDFFIYSDGDFELREGMHKSELYLPTYQSIKEEGFVIFNKNNLSKNDSLIDSENSLKLKKIVYKQK